MDIAIVLIGFCVLSPIGLWVLWRIERTPAPDCPKCNYRREGQRLHALNANFCPACGHLLTSHYQAERYMTSQRSMLYERERLGKAGPCD